MNYLKYLVHIQKSFLQDPVLVNMSAKCKRNKIKANNLFKFEKSTLIRKGKKNKKTVKY